MSADAADIVAALTAGGLTIATAESLTGGLVCAALTEVPGASACVRGGIVAYDPAVKADLLQVEQALLDRRGAVDPEVSRQMARGVRVVLGASYGVATTGSAGPDPAPGGTAVGAVTPGTGFVAVSGPDGELVRGFHIEGDRGMVREGAVSAALDLLREILMGGGGA